MIDRKTPDEITLRRPEFVGGGKVLLADGQEWYFPRPSLRYRIHIDPLTRKPLYRPEPSEDWITAEYCEVLDTMGAMHLSEYVPAVAGLAMQLLARNYQLTDELIPELFTYEPGSGTSLRMWGAIRLAVTGQLDPK